jgi:ABC-type transport system involved in cytochrome bd biosynthesis fused ATPase/permease subunit
MSKYSTDDSPLATAPWIARDERRSAASAAATLPPVARRFARSRSLNAGALFVARPVSAPASPTPRATPGKVHLACRGLFKSYRKGPVGIPVLQGIDLEVREGEFLAIIGQSGCGKSTLLHLLGTLDSPDDGEVQFEGHRIDNLPTARDLLRNKHIGMIFQFYHFLPELSTLENILAPASLPRAR